MRRSIRRQVLSCWASLLTLLIMLVVVTSASADCAWVLWKSIEHSGLGSPTEPKVKKDWEIIRAVPQNQICEKILEARWKVEVAQARKDESAGFHIKVTSNDNAVGWYSTSIGPQDKAWHQNIEFFCLPDAVDPRGPKGGRPMTNEDRRCA